MKRIRCAGIRRAAAGSAAAPGTPFRPARLGHTAMIVHWLLGLLFGVHMPTAEPVAV
jgi:hypothetical protein